MRPRLGPEAYTRATPGMTFYGTEKYWRPTDTGPVRFACPRLFPSGKESANLREIFKKKLTARSEVMAASGGKRTFTGKNHIR